MKCHGCGNPLARVFTISGTIRRGVFEFDASAELLCPSCLREEAWRLVFHQDDPAIPVAFEAPQHCPTCNGLLDSLDCAFDVNYDVDPPAATEPTVCCPHCHDDLSSVAPVRVEIPPHDILEPRRCRVCGCTDDNPCIDDAGVTCGWWGDEDLCFARACLARAGGE